MNDFMGAGIGAIGGFMGVGIALGVGGVDLREDGTWVCEIGLNGSGGAFGTGMSVFFNVSGVISVIVLIGSGFGGSLFSLP